MLPDKDIGCHRAGFSRKCRELVSSGECKRFVQIMGVNPQTGKEVSGWDCIDNWTPFLLLENTKEQRHTAKAVESFRNEMVTANGVLSIQQRIFNTRDSVLQIEDIKK